MNSNSSLVARVVCEGERKEDMDNTVINGRQLQIENGTFSSENINAARGTIDQTTEEMHCSFENMIRNRCVAEEQKALINNLSSDIFDIKVELKVQKIVSAKKAASLRDEIQILKENLSTLEAYSPREMLIKFERLQTVVDKLVVENEILVRSNEEMIEEIKHFTMKAPVNTTLEKPNSHDHGFSDLSLYHPVSELQITEMSWTEDQSMAVCVRGLQECSVFTVQEPADDKDEESDSFVEYMICSSLEPAMSDGSSGFQMATAHDQDAHDELAVAVVEEIHNKVERSIFASDNYIGNTVISDGSIAPCHLATVREDVQVPDDVLEEHTDHDERDEVESLEVEKEMEDDNQVPPSKDDTCSTTTVDFSCPSASEQTPTDEQEKEIKIDVISTPDDVGTLENFEKETIEVDGKSIEIYRFNNDNNHHTYNVPHYPDATNINENPIGCLQEACYARDWEVPSYEFSMNLQGGDGRFIATCNIQGISVKGLGQNKKSAKRQAATVMFCEHFAKNDNLQR